MRWRCDDNTYFSWEPVLFAVGHSHETLIFVWIRGFCAGHRLVLPIMSYCKKTEIFNAEMTGLDCGICVRRLWVSHIVPWSFFSSKSADSFLRNCRTKFSENYLWCEMRTYCIVVDQQHLWNAGASTSCECPKREIIPTFFIRGPYLPKVEKWSLMVGFQRNIKSAQSYLSLLWQRGSTARTANGDISPLRAALATIRICHSIIMPNNLPVFKKRSISTKQLDAFRSSLWKNLKIHTQLIN
jgi:hypothetical protein